ncbi:MAG: archease [Candidatus Omnitrophica bacterium CG_4_9_14_0_2_um_filter_42_8]|nr:MAG: archease [Candidatus Omnitrophica bacterium CG22_combo_CG10-13_8_21_14_all_43_16]PJC47180.1 MAG: archease [Candidatus Omnitrophica bacterium CG_4_9_14_0_2_um_filter_42_8]
MKPFELIEHTADVGIKARGATLTELFENAARGMFYVIAGEGYKAQGSKVEKKIEICKNRDNYEETLVSWLSELLYTFNREKIYFNDFKILSLNDSALKAEAGGINIDLYQSNIYTEIKAVTFHNLKIEEDVDGFSCTIIFDV